ncbi:hypothetical protein DIS24_g11644 [Lasiodiplodia hormozganensis]|uniref:F-box domain-containing protein n=1 Tax=Lasiodiplodia hormozganensis TaxID=869390 RepID=A0AA39WNK9_9PEZI|nr:hypothetical protein DIS24_g11644 [Lasiodiplodia hormozganensis]
MSLEALPPELKMNIASHLQLRELILLRNASRCWQTLINNNLSLIPRSRRKLLGLWDDTLRSPYFLPSRHSVTADLYDFDRRQYLASISHGLPLPEEFEVWVLEWPAKAVIGWMWPGLDRVVVSNEDGCNVFPVPEYQWWQVVYGHNLLSAQPTGPDLPLYVWDKATRSEDETSVWERDWNAHLRSNGDRERLHRRVADDDVGVAIPVWSADSNSAYGDERTLDYVLVISGLGATYNCSVQPFRVQSAHGGIETVTHLDRDAVERGLWQDGFWTEGLIHATSWVEWLHRQLELLDTDYKRFGTIPLRGYID